MTGFTQNELLCELKPEMLNQTKRGLPFLGYLLFPHNVRLSQQSKRRFIRKIAYVEAQYHSGAWSEAACQRHALPLLAFTQHADAKKFREKVILPNKGLSS